MQIVKTFIVLSLFFKLSLKLFCEMNVEVFKLLVFLSLTFETSDKWLPYKRPHDKMLGLSCANLRLGLS